MLVNLDSVGRSQYAATHAHNWVFSLWPFPPRSVSSYPFPLLFCFFLQLPLSTYLLCLSSLCPFSDSPIFIQFPPLSLYVTASKTLFYIHTPIFPFKHPTTHFPCSWLTGRFTQPVGEHITPSWMGERSHMRGDVSGVYQQFDSVQWCELRLEQVPAVLPQGC